MLAGNPATVITFPALGSSVAPFLPADLDGSTLPPSGAPNTFVGFPDSGQYILYHFHVDFVVPPNSTFATFATPPAAAFTFICPATRACVPQAGVTSTNNLDAIGDRLMFRLAYRNFADHESVVGNFTVQANGVAGIRWFELRGVSAGPATVFQESTYQPDSTWRWMGSIAMNKFGDIALGFSASSDSINPQIRYTGRHVSDPLNSLPQGEAHIFDGSGSQIDSGNRWGDYSAMSLDPVDDTTFWYTDEYYATNSSFNWRTRIGNFRLPISARADFNADGNSDVIWQNNVTGQRAIWLMNGTNLATAVSLTTLGTAWNIMGSGDFNSDGSPDILWQNNITGVRVIWLMNGTSFVSFVSLGTVATVWNIAGSGDFNGDGKADILWQNSSTGLRTVWLMDGTNFFSSVTLGAATAAWSIVGSGDFDHDGNTDILWQNNSTGQRLVWLMNGTSYVSSVFIGVLANSWNIGGTGDYNLDGSVDVLFQDSVSGARVVWLMNGTTFVSSVPFATRLGSSWNIRNF